MVAIKYIFITVNIILCLSFGFGVLAFYKIGKPYVRGYYCFDESISKPLKNDTVTVSALLAFVFTLYPVCILIVEGIKMSNKIKVISTNFIIKVVRHVLHNFWIFIYGAGITMFITDVGKYSIGRLRPHYLTLCKPDWSNINCSYTFGDKAFIVGDDFCRVPNRALLKDARMSFPSGHTSFAVYCATFMILYLQLYPLSIPQRRRFSFLLLFIQVILSCLAIFTGLSRVSDYKHHPTDVIAGGIVGLVVAFTIFFNVLKYVDLSSSEKTLSLIPSYHRQLPPVTNDHQLNDIVVK